MDDINNEKIEIELNPAVEKIAGILKLTESEILELKIKQERK
jgi:hypothetical protein